MKINKLKKIAKNEFWKNLKKRKLEDLDAIQLIENYFTKKRGYVFRMPKPRSTVILLVSGGMDSIIAWAMLMEIYKLKVLPVHIKTGQIRQYSEYRSFYYFVNFFKKKYPQTFIDPFELTYYSPPPEINSKFKKNLWQNIHASNLIKNYDRKNNEVVFVTKYLFPAFMPFAASLVALFNDLNSSDKVRTVFTSIVSTDGLGNESQTFTALRSTMFALCNFTCDSSWQVTSIAFEKEIGHFLDKTDLMKWAHNYGLPIEKTYSCWKGFLYNCGSCKNCLDRREAFRKLNIQDMTIYLEDNLIHPNVYFIYFKIIHYFNKFLLRANGKIKKIISKYTSEENFFKNSKIEKFKPKIRIKDWY